MTEAGRGSAVREGRAHTLIVGIGNSLAGDDAVGLEAARRLSELPLPDGVRVVATNSPGLDLIDLLAGADRAILLDSIVMAGPAGSIRRIALDELEVRRGAISAHDLTVAEALRLAQVAEPERLPGEIVIIAMAIAWPASGTAGLSEEARAGVSELVQAALRELEEGGALTGRRSCTKLA